MYISINTSLLNQLKDDAKCLSILQAAGFTAYDYSMYEGDARANLRREDYKEKAKELRRFADEIGIACNQSHAPFPSWKIGDEQYNNVIFDEIVRSIEITGILGGRLCVVHPCNDATPEQNAAFYNRLLPYAKANNVKIALENMWNWVDGYPAHAACSSAENFLAHLELLDKEWFVALLDIGHSEMMYRLGTNAVEMIYALKDRLAGLHIHDNNRYHDNHASPFTMNINFEEICKALKEVEYEGDITLEVFKYPQMPTELCLAHGQFIYASAKHFWDLLRK